MESFLEWVVRYAHQAHWLIFPIILLAGLNIPISVDLIILAAAFLAATVIPQHAWLLYLSIFFGCYFSAWLSYWVGRLAGQKLCRYRWFNKLLPPERLDKTQHFYQKYGFWTLLIGRFIPFGVRNCIFMASGMSRFHFGKFALWDFIACGVWSFSVFYLFFTVGQHYQVVWHYVKTFNLLIFAAFSVTLIGFIWYKRRKKQISQTS
jgi:membrane protein DedA with SNARE-associated domain